MAVVGVQTATCVATQPTTHRWLAIDACTAAVGARGRESVVLKVRLARVACEELLWESGSHAAADEMCMHLDGHANLSISYARR